MSSQTIALNNGQQAIVHTDTSKIFLWENRYANGVYNNGTYDTVVLVAGTLMGRIAATQKLTPVASGAVDGSQYPVGILAGDYSVEAGEDQDISICNYGDVNESKVILDGADTLATVIEDRSIRDRIAGDTVGIRLIVSEEMTATDNE